MKQLKDYLHYYIGCKMIRSSHWEPQYEPYILTFENIREAIEFSDRPLLCRLEDMTEEDWYSVEAETSLMIDAHGLNAVRDNFMIGTDEYRLGWTIVNDALIAMRKRGIDVDGLIDAGLAIDAKPLTP